MNGHGKSDRRVVPTKPPNNGVDPAPMAGCAPAEAVEGRRLAKGKPHQQTMLRTQRRVGMPHELERIRQAASRNRKMRFTALYHHVYRHTTLRRAYFGLNPKGIVKLLRVRRSSDVRVYHPGTAVPLRGSLHTRDLGPTLESIPHLFAVRRC